MLKESENTNLLRLCSGDRLSLSYLSVFLFLFFFFLFVCFFLSFFFCFFGFFFCKSSLKIELPASSVRRLDNQFQTSETDAILIPLHKNPPQSQDAFTPWSFVYERNNDPKRIPNSDPFFFVCLAYLHLAKNCPLKIRKSDFFFFFFSGSGTRRGQELTFSVSGLEAFDDHFKQLWLSDLHRSAINTVNLERKTWICVINSAQPSSCEAVMSVSLADRVRCPRARVRRPLSQTAGASIWILAF